MKDKYLLVDKSILPDYYEKVIEARKFLSSGKYKDVSEAVRAVGISRSTYYKYKDYVFNLNEDTECRKAVLSFSLLHKAGILGAVLGKLSEYGANILTITQNLPIQSHAHVVVLLDLSRVTISVEALTEALNGIEGVSGARTISIE